MASIKLFGKYADKPVYLIKLANEKIEVELISFGATIRSLKTLGKDGKLHDICLGYDSVEEYAENDGYIGATVGRNANRISDSRFCIGGKEYTLSSNEGKNQLHGGIIGFSHRLWNFSCTENSATFTIASPDGDEGYPGNLNASVTFSISGATLRIEYNAKSDADTVVNMTNHAYFNLGGHDSGEIYHQELFLGAESYTLCGEGNIPTGEIIGVKGSPLDFTKSITLESSLKTLSGSATEGIDHNFVLSSSPAAIVRCENTGIEMRCTTSLEGIQVYTAGFLSERKGKGGAFYGKHHAMCLETQHFPDAVNRPNFPSPVLKAGEEYNEWTEYSFSLC